VEGLHDARLLISQAREVADSRFFSLMIDGSRFSRLLVLAQAGPVPDIAKQRSANGIVRLPE
jgi:hypothetical protein